MSMQSTLDGASTRAFLRTAGPDLRVMPATLAATPESIHWTQTRHERAVAARHGRIATAAYLISKARGFEPGHEKEDWLAAQSRIDAIDSGSSQT